MRRRVVRFLALTATSVALLGFHGCVLTTRQKGIFLGTLIGAPAGAVIGNQIRCYGEHLGFACDSTGSRCTDLGFAPDHSLSETGAVIGLGAGAIAGWVIGSLVSDDGPESDRNACVPGRVLGVTANGTDAALRGIGLAIGTANRLALESAESLPSINAGLLVFRYTDQRTPENVARDLALDPRVTLAQPVYRYATATSGVDEGLVYGPSLIGADRVRALATGKGVRIAIIDTGVDTARAELRRAIRETYDVTGYGFTPDAHGTFIAGVIAAATGTSPAPPGIAPDAEIVAIKACQPLDAEAVQATATSSTVARALDLGIRRNAQVINMSLCGPRDGLVGSLVETAVAHGAVVVAAVGNDGPSHRPRFPAGRPDVIAVTAVDRNDRLYSKANRGKSVDLAAPGVEIISLGPGRLQPLTTGTSLATAFATGAVALLLERAPDLSPLDVQILLEESARDLGKRGKDSEFGSGLLDAAQAMQRITRAELP